MANPKVFICDCDHANVDQENKVFTEAGVDYQWLQCKTQEEVIEKCQGAVAFLNQYVRMDEVIFKAIPTLKLVVRYGVGVDNVNLADATKYGVQVTNVPDYGVFEVADHSLALMLDIVRKVSFLNRRVHEKVWKYSEAVPIPRIAESTIGVVGLGRIGSAFAQRAHALGAKVIGFDKSASRRQNLPEFVEMKNSLEEVLRESDIVSLHCTLDESNKGMLNKETFAMMKDGAFLVNTARGGLIDEAALVEVLKSGKLAAAGLDVLCKEPIPADHALFECENAIITPHSAWYSVQAAKELKRKCAEDAVNFVSGRPVKYPVNRLP